MHKQTLDSKDETISRLASTMPDDQQALFEIAYKSIVSFHDNILSNQPESAYASASIYDAVIWKLNGDTFLGACKDENAAGCLVEAYCRPTQGVIPMWGQTGDFLIVIKGIPCIVHYTMSCHSSFNLFSNFSFHAIDKNQLFISETGYKSHYENITYGKTVDEVASSIFKRYLTEDIRRIDQSITYTLSASQEWLKKAIPDAFELVSVIVPKHKAFIASKWAKEAAVQLDTIRSAKQKTLNAKT